MLQFVTYPGAGIPAHQQVSTALEGGCGWVRLTLPVSDEELGQFIKLCRENDIILTLDDDLEMVDRYRIHGLHLTSWDRGSAIEAREKLGPHAIVGVTCRSVDEVNELKGLDIDYMTIPVADGVSPLEYLPPFTKEIADKGVEIHPVAAGNFPLEIMKQITSTGVEGVEISGEILGAPDPVGMISLYIKAVADSKG